VELITANQKDDFPAWTLNVKTPMDQLQQTLLVSVNFPTIHQQSKTKKMSRILSQYGYMMPRKPTVHLLASALWWWDIFH
jgi:hypothetical protein